MVAMILGMSSTGIINAKNVEPDFNLKKLELLIADTMMINSINYKAPKVFDRYELNFNTDLKKLSNFLKLDSTQRTIVIDVNNTIAREFARMNTIEDFNERTVWFEKTINHSFSLLKYVLDDYQMHNYKMLVNVTLINRGYLKNGQFVDIFAKNSSEGNLN